MKAVGSWAPADNEGTIYTLGSCSAHYFDVKGSLIAYAWYGQGTRILDISEPEKPIQVAYFRPDGGNVWASYFRNGYVYTADAARGVDILKLNEGAKAASAAKKEVNAPKMSEEAGLVPAEHGVQALGLRPVDRRALPAAGRSVST